MHEVRPPDVEADMVPIEVPPGGAAFHDGLTFHGSPPNERPDRGSAGDHQPHGHDGHDAGTRPCGTRSTRATCVLTNCEMDEVYFPIMWREDGYRTPYIESHFTPAV